ncbi:hypothetical protein N0V84_005675 [Fusarium piperis]|uniref:HMG box domain-containing protein n=1 Tax=Fusarium piperis TaxID=1435070 RepID=A0A9W8WDD4_9HYPO|nr:hypothetical protein N0V84_005675 [Fusarium piperis]
MLTAVGRAAARRIQAPSAHPAAVAQLLLRQAPVASALPIRAFSASALAQLPAASDKKSKSKATAKKPAAAAAAKKKAAAPTKKKAAPATKPVGRPKKVLDPEEEQEEKRKAEVRELKKWALRDTPATLPNSKWAQFVVNNKDLLKGSAGLGPHMSGLADKFKSLSAAELNNLETIAAANREKNATNLKSWIKTHEPARIHIANQARRRLSKLTGKSYRTLEDERLPKRPLSSYTNFTVVNWPRLGGTDAVDGSKNISQAWKALSASEKAVYEEQTAQASAQYEAEMEVVRARADSIKAEADPKSKK